MPRIGDQNIRVRDFMLKLLNPPDNNGIRKVNSEFKDIRKLHAFLRREGFALAETAPHGPDGGTLLQYWSGVFQSGGVGMIVRVKTHGEPEHKRYRAGQAHLSVVYQGGIASDLISKDDVGIREYKENEMYKFDADGYLRDKGETDAEYTHFDFTVKTLKGAMSLAMGFKDDRGQIVTVEQDRAR